MLYIKSLILNRETGEMMRFKKTILFLLTVGLVASLAAITVNAARSSTASTHVYSSSSSTGNTNGISVYEDQSADIVDSSVINGSNAGPGYTTSLYKTQATGIVGNSPVNVYSAGIGSNSTI